MIAVLGWGSLIWNPGDLDIEPEWRTDGPELPIEFARVSSGDRLTLVLVEGAPPQPTQWACSRKTKLAEAVEDLRRREGTIATRIGRWTGVGDSTSKASEIESVIAGWAQERGLDGVVWTALGPRKPDGTSGLASEDERVDYLRDLVATDRAAAAREYFERTPEQIVAPMRQRIREELGWT